MRAQCVSYPSHLIVIVLALSASSFAQPYRGPFVVASTINGISFSEIAVSGWGERAEIVVIDSASELNMSVQQLSVNLNDGSLVGSPAELLITDSSQFRLAGVISDSSLWISMVYEGDDLTDDVGENRLWLFSYDGNALRTETLNAGFWPGVSPPPTPDDEYGTYHSLQRRLGGGFLTGWLRNSVNDTGGRDNSVVMRLYNDSFVVDSEYVTRSTHLPYGPTDLQFVSLASAWVGELYSEGGQDYYARVRSDSMFPGELPLMCDARALILGLSNQDHVLCITDTTSDAMPFMFSLNPDGACGWYGEFSFWEILDLAYQREYGFAGAIRYGSELWLIRKENQGQFVHDEWLRFWRSDFCEVADAAISITDEGLVIVAWAIRDYLNPTADTLMIASVGFYEPLFVERTGTGVLPSYYSLSSYPNPFNSTTTMTFTMPVQSRVELALYDLIGRRVRTVLDEWRAAGEYRVSVDAAKLPSGIYFTRMKAGTVTKSQKLLLLK